MRHFKPAEFREWFEQIHPKLYTSLDEFREQLGVPVSISPVKGAIGRHKGMMNRSRHNIDYWHTVQAIDILPHWDNIDQFEKAIDIAEEVGFGGIGFYSKWKPRPGLHLDIRNDPVRWWTSLVEDGGEWVQKYTYLHHTELKRKIKGWINDS